MKMRKGAPLLFALAALLGSVQAASASHCGALRFSSLSRACGDAQCCYSSCQQQNRVCYKLVYDTVMEKRWHTCYQTVCETVNKQVSRTCYKEETRYKDCHVTKYKTVAEECTRPVMRTCWKDVHCHAYKPQIECCVREVECCVRRCVPKHCEKACHYTVCKPVYEQHCHVQHCHVQKQICEVHCHQACHRVCRPVTEHCHREVCCQVSKCIEECHVKQVCVPCCKDVVETCYKNCTRRICEPCTTTKCVTKRVIECVEEPCGPIGSGLRGLFSGIGLGRGNRGCDPCDPCATHKSARTDCCDPCFDPCACKTFHLFDRARSNRCCEPCCTPCDCRPAPTRKVWRVRCVTENVTCTTYVTRCVTEKVPYTVCRKVQYNEVRNVPYVVRRNIRGAYVDAKGVAFECDAPDRTFKEGAVARKLVPYTVTKMVTSIETKMVPYTVTRIARGAYVEAHAAKDAKPHFAAKADGKGDIQQVQAVTYGEPATGRVFQEGATYRVVNTYTTTRMVQEERVKKVPYTVYETVIEKQIKQVPYQVCRMVPYTVTKKVPYQECVMEKYTVCRKVPYTECIKVPYCCKVAYTVCESVPCQVTRKVKVCVPETVCVKKARLVPVVVDPGCGDSCQEKCRRGWNLFKGCNCCETNCCNDCCKPGFLSGLRQRCFASLCSTGCCQESCTTTCKSTCNDGCHDYCREGLMQRLFRNRFACDPCCNSGCTSGTTAPAAPAEKVAPPKKLPS